jgi:hypothetical protein
LTAAAIFVVFSQLYPIRNIHWGRRVTQNTCNFNAVRRSRERLYKPPGIRAIIDQMCVILVTVSGERL